MLGLRRPSSPRTAFRCRLAFAGLVLTSVWLLSLAQFAVPALGQFQPLAAQVGNATATEEFDDVFLPAPRELLQKLERARTAIEDGAYSEAVIELGDLLTSGDAEDYFVGKLGTEGARTSVKVEAQRLLGAMPKAGRDAYELRYGADARRLLEEAVEGGDVDKLSEATRMYFHTKAGYEAAALLGRVQMDQGRPFAAALCYQRLIVQPEARDRFGIDLPIQLAAAWYLAGDARRAADVLVDLQRENPAASIRIAGEPVRIFAASSDVVSARQAAVKWLQDALGAGMLESGMLQSEWAMFRGSPSRNASAAGAMPLFSFRWKVPTVNEPAGEATVQMIEQTLKSQGAPAIPTVQPLAVDGTIIMRTPYRVMGVHFETGKRIWEFPWYSTTEERFDDALARQAAAVGGLPTTPDERLRQRLLEDNTFGQVACDGEFVYMLDEVGFASESGMMGGRVIIGFGGRGFDNPDAARTKNKLVALDLKRQGKLTWIVGGDNGEDEKALAGVFFLGPPLPLQGQLYVLGEAKNEIRLYALESRSGKLLWSQQIAQVEASPIADDPQRRLAGATPSFSDGVLLCPTSAGAVVAVDLSTRSLLWGYQYKSIASPSQYGYQNMDPPREVGSRWNDATILIADGKAFVTPIESDYLFALDLLTGEPAFPAQPRGEGLYLGGVYEDKLVIVKRTGVSAIRTTDGKSVWDVTLPDGAMPSGQGFHSDAYYFLPCDDSAIRRIHLVEGRIDSTAKTGAKLGNLICYRDQIVSHSLDGLTAFYQDEPLRQEIERRLQADPEDVWALERRGEMLLRDGDQDEALRFLRKAFEKKASEATRDLLVQALLSALQTDFASTEQIAKELEPLVEREDHRATFLRSMAQGYLEAGRRREAFDRLMQIAELQPTTEFRLFGRPTDELDAVDSKLKMSRDRWVASRLRTSYEAADPAEQDWMRERIEARRTAILEAKDPDSLRQFLRFFSFLTATVQPVREALSVRLIESGELLEAEQVLSDLAASGDPEARKFALVRETELLISVGRFDEARLLAETIKNEFAEQPVAEGKTGAQAYAAWLEANEPMRWAYGVRWNDGQVAVEATGSGDESVNAYKREYVLEGSRRGEFLDPRSQFLYEQHSRSLALRDAFGAIRLRVALQRSDNANFYSGNFDFLRTFSREHLALFSHGFELVACNLLEADASNSQLVLWRDEFTSPQPGVPPNQAFRVQPDSDDTPWGPDVVAANDWKQRRMGCVSDLGPNGVCYLRLKELICVDPLTGQSHWRRSDIVEGSSMFGDAEYVFVTPPGSEVATVFRVFDGEVVGERPLPPESRRFVTVGASVLAWDERRGADQTFMLLGGAFEGEGDERRWVEKELWRETFESGTRASLVSETELAVYEPNGRFRTMDLVAGTPLLDRKLDPQRSLLGVYVLPGEEDRIVIANVPVTDAEPNANVMSAPAGSEAPLMNAFVYSLDAKTGDLRWPTSAHVNQFGFPLDQPQGLPFLVFMRQITPSVSKGPRRITTEAIALDRGDGRTILDESIGSSTNFYEAEARPGEQRGTLRLPSKTFEMRFTQEDRPPAPPAKVGDFSLRQREKVEEGVSLEAEVRRQARNLGENLVPRIRVREALPAAAPPAN